MGTFKKGILGGFSGTVGTVAGGNRKGIDDMRSRPVGNNSSSSAQLVQRAKFSLAAKFLRSMKNLLTISFKDFANKMTGPNSALAYALKNAITGEYPDFNLDYSLALVSRGSLPNAAAPGASSTQPGVINFNWSDNSGIGIAKATDKAILVAYSPDFNQCIYTTAGAKRSETAATLDVRAFSGKTVETWLAFITASGKDVAPSMYTGKVIVA
jgi:hypothetical protein